MEESGYKIYGFGAHPGATILIYTFKLEAFIDYSFDKYND